MLVVYASSHSERRLYHTASVASFSSCGIERIATVGGITDAEFQLMVLIGFALW